MCIGRTSMWRCIDANHIGQARATLSFSNGGKRREGPSKRKVAETKSVGSGHDIGNSSGNSNGNSRNGSDD